MLLWMALLLVLLLVLYRYWTVAVPVLVLVVLLDSSGTQYTVTVTVLAGTGTGAITEAGIFNASTNGTMLCRTVFPVVTKQAGDTIAITWKVTVS